MNLLEKFSAIEIRADSRLSTADKQFCDQQQAAYSAALQGFQSLKVLWTDMLAAQKSLLGEPDSSPRSYNQYLISDCTDGPQITLRRLRIQIDNLHRKFIRTIANYFHSVYDIAFSVEAIESELLRSMPKKGTQGKNEYLRHTNTVALQYVDIVSLMSESFEGRSFSEQALSELQYRCGQAAWDAKTHQAHYERRNTVISLLLQFSLPAYSRGAEYWESRKHLKNILIAAAHFETESFHTIPPELEELVNGEKQDYDQIEFSACSKLAGLRLFKNGRANLRFTNEDYANQFIDIYLGRVYRELESEGIE